MEQLPLVEPPDEEPTERRSPYAKVAGGFVVLVVAAWLLGGLVLGFVSVHRWWFVRSDR